MICGIETKEMDGYVTGVPRDLFLIQETTKNGTQ